MNTDTETAAALFRHDFNEAGVCEAPEVVDVPALPKHFTAVVRLALAEDGWRVGFEYEGPPVGVGMRGVLPCLADTIFQERVDALQAGCNRLIEALAGKSRARRAVEAIKVFLTAQGGAVGPAPVVSEESSPANKEASAVAPTLQVLALGDLAVDGRNPRKAFAAADLEELAESIARNGILQPLVVRKRRPIELDKDLVLAGGLLPEYIVVAGERRFRAAFLLAEQNVAVAIPCVVYEKLSDQQALIIALTENLQRAGMNPIEEAEGFDRLLKFGFTQQDIGEKVGKSRPVIANALRLLALPESVREILRSGALTTAHGVALARFKAWPKIAARIADLAITKKTPAGDLEEGLPYSYDLEEEELVAEIHLWEFRDEFKLSAEPGEQGIPKVLADQPWLLVDRSDVHSSDPELWAMDVPAYTQWMADRRSAQEAAEAAAAPKSKKSTPSGPVVDLSKLKYTEFKKVKDISPAILKQLPADSIERGDYYHDKNIPVVRGLGLALANKLERAATIDKNREKREELDAAWVTALARIQSIDTIGAEHMSQLLGWSCGDYHIGSQSEVVTDVAEALGMELPKGIRTIELRNAEKLARFSPLELLRFILALRARAAWRVARRDASALPDDLKLFAAVEAAKPAKKKAPKSKAFKKAA